VLLKARHAAGESTPAGLTSIGGSPCEPLAPRCAARRARALGKERATTRSGGHGCAARNAAGRTLEVVAVAKPRPRGIPKNPY
jgi:hypothetical protein